jgi:hypothetical protein
MPSAATLAPLRAGATSLNSIPTMTEFESNAASDPFAAPAMTSGLNDMGLPQSLPPATPPRRPKPVPNTEDVQALFINPALAERFDRQWGEGAAKNLLDKYRFLQSTSAGQPVIDAAPVTGEAAQADEASEAAAERLRRSVRRQPTEDASAWHVLPDMLPSERDPSLLQQQEIGLYERHRLNRRDSFYRGTLAGAGYLAMMKHAADSVDEPGLTPAVRRARESVRRQYLAIVADLARYDAMDPFGTELEAVAAFTGQFTGGLPSPESLAGASIKSTYAIARFAWAAAQQGLIALGTDPFIQKASIHSGVQEDYDGWRTAMRAALAVTIGPLGAMVGRGHTTSDGVSAGRRGLPGEGPAASDVPRASPTFPSGTVETPAQGPATSRASTTSPDSSNAERKQQEWRDATPNKTWDDHYRTAQRWQDELAAVGEPIAQETGTTFVNPGIKDRMRAEGKPGRKPGYRGPQDVTDVVRASFLLDQPEQADALVSLLSRQFGPDNVIDEGWKKSIGAYMDRKALVRFTDGTIGELQLAERHMFPAKKRGDILYKQRRELPEDDPRFDELAQAERKIFQDVLDAWPDEWMNLYRRAASGK